MAKTKKDAEPPSLFDNLDLFTSAPSCAADGLESSSAVAGDGQEKPKRTDGGGRKPSKAVATATPPPSPPHPAPGLTGSGPMRDLFDINFRQYSAYVICSRAIPSVEDGLKPVQRRILHALFEQDDGRYTKVANIVGQTMQYHPHGDASIGDAIVVLANKLWG